MSDIQDPENSGNNSTSISDDKAAFLTQADKRGLSEQTISTLQVNGIYTEDLLCKLNEITLPVTAGQKLKIRKWVEECKTKEPINFTRQAYIHHLDDDTLRELCKQDINNADDLKEITDAQIDTFNITYPQRDLLHRWNCEMHCVPISDDIFDEGDVKRNLFIRARIMVEINNYLQVNGLKRPKEYMERLRRLIRYEYPHKMINVAIIGPSGKGKSQFINTIRHMGHTDLGAAAVDTGARLSNGTTVPQVYGVKYMPNVAIWDLPGFGKPGFHKYTYINDIKFSSYDIVIIFGGSEMSKGDEFLAEEATQLCIPFYYVYTKIDEELQSKKVDKAHEAIYVELLCQRKLAKLPPGQSGRKLYVISNMLGHQSSWDFKQLKEDIHKHVKLGKSKILTKAAIDSAQRFIKTNFEKLYNGIAEVGTEATECRKVNDIPIFVKKYISKYQKMFHVPCTLDWDTWAARIELKLMGVTDRVSGWIYGCYERRPEECHMIKAAVRKVLENILDECKSSLVKFFTEEQNL